MKVPALTPAPFTQEAAIAGGRKCIDGASQAQTSQNETILDGVRPPCQLLQPPMRWRVTRQQLKWTPLPTHHLIHVMDERPEGRIAIRTLMDRFKKPRVIVYWPEQQ